MSTLQKARSGRIGCLTLIAVLIICGMILNAIKKMGTPAAAGWVVVGTILLLGGFLIRRMIRRHRGLGAPTATTRVVDMGGDNLLGTETASSYEASLRWLGSGATLYIGPYTIRDPLTYSSDGATDPEEASCINTQLVVGSPAVEPRGALGYWPRYSQITPDQRANYLEWMSRGRKGLLEDIGYAFIFFYGLERRALVDEQDTSLIIAETLRLIETYPESNSFRGYLTAFIAYVLARFGFDSATPDQMNRLIRASMKHSEAFVVEVTLAWLQQKMRPVPPEVAFDIASRDLRARATVLRQAPEQFRSLFRNKYVDRFPAGLQLKPTGRRVAVIHRPASGSLIRSSQGTLPPAWVPEVAGHDESGKILHPLTTFLGIWDECVEELRPLSRQLAKGREVTTRQAYRVLPDALKAETPHPDADRWATLIGTLEQENGICLTTAGEIASLCEVEARHKLTLTQSKDIAETAGDVGYILVPDPRTIGRPFQWEESVTLFRPSSGIVAPTADKQFLSAVIMLSLGIAVAAADGHVDPEEVAHLLNFLRSSFPLEGDDGRRLDAYRAIWQRNPPPLLSLVSSLRTAWPENIRHAAGAFLVSVAAINGRLDRKELSILRRAFTALGLSAESLQKIVKELFPEPTQPVEVARAHPAARTGEPLPLQTAPREGVKLDFDSVKHIMAETAEVSRLIAAALPSAEGVVLLPVASPSRQQATSSEPGRFDGLDAAYHGVLNELLARSSWPAAELRELAGRHDLMVSALVDRINTWSEEHLGDFLVEEGDPYLVNTHLLSDDR